MEKIKCGLKRNLKVKGERKVFQENEMRENMPILAL